jgi:hypothetical protein
MRISDRSLILILITLNIAALGFAEIQRRALIDVSGDQKRSIKAQVDQSVAESEIRIQALLARSDVEQREAAIKIGQLVDAAVKRSQ